MGCGPEVAGSVYHPRQPHQTPFYQLVRRFYPHSLRRSTQSATKRVMASGGPLSARSWASSWNAAISSRALPGALPPVSGRVLCGLSYRVHSFCPSCHEKRALEKAVWVAEHVCAQVPHRQRVVPVQTSAVPTGRILLPTWDRSGSGRDFLMSRPPWHPTLSAA
jgi:hypothetical protein